MIKQGTATSYRVFVRNWWRYNPSPAWSNPGSPYHGLEPDPGARKTTIAKGCTEEEARQVCREYNTSHAPGRLSRKAEYERE